MVLVSRRPLTPSSRVTDNQSVKLASGDSPVPDGLMSLVFGKTSGRSCSGTAVDVPSSQWMIGIGSPQ